MSSIASTKNQQLVVKTLTLFLQKHLDPKRPLLLALSGGEDSLALFYALLAYKENYPLDLHLAHVDHGWREESLFEKMTLTNLAESHGLPIHIYTIEKNEYMGNLEASARSIRYDFFQKVSLKINAQATLTAHHADDQAETVMKRFFEGSSIASLKGMSECSIMNGHHIWRPWLNVEKKMIREWLLQSGKKGFMDPTNADPKFLRARMRMQILPHLSGLFGKQISPTLCRLSKEAAMYNDYLDRKCQPLFKKLKKGPFGTWIDLSIFTDLHFLEFRHFLKLWFLNYRCHLSDAELECAWEKLSSGNKKITHGPFSLHIDRKRLFLFEDTIYEVPPTIALSDKSTWGPWNVTLKNVPSPKDCSNWCDALNGHMCYYLPKSSYSLLPYQPHLKLTDSKLLSEHFTALKMPKCLSWIAPIIIDQATGMVAGEFLSGSQKKDRPGAKWLEIKLTICN